MVSSCLAEKDARCDCNTLQVVDFSFSFFGKNLKNISPTTSESLKTPHHHRVGVFMLLMVHLGDSDWSLPASYQPNLNSDASESAFIVNTLHHSSSDQSWYLLANARLFSLMWSVTKGLTAACQNGIPSSFCNCCCTVWSLTFFRFRVHLLQFRGCYEWIFYHFSLQQTVCLWRSHLSRATPRLRERIHALMGSWAAARIHNTVVLWHPVL